MSLVPCFVGVPHICSLHFQQVKDRTVIQTTDAERKTTSPAGLQSAIDELVEQYNRARSFVRYV